MALSSHLNACEEVLNVIRNENSWEKALQTNTSSLQLNTIVSPA